MPETTKTSEKSEGTGFNDSDAYRVLLEIPVWWGDQDAFGHVNNTVYLRWFESARIEYSNRIGLTTMMKERRIGPILAALQCDFRSQLTYPDVVSVGVKVSRVGRTSLTMEHRIVSRRLGAIAAEGSSTLVVFDYSANRPTPVPDEIRRAIELLEKGEDSPSVARP